MTERTHRIDWDDTLQRILTEPSHAARLLLATADALDEQPFLNVTEDELDRASCTAIEKVVHGLPEVVMEEATSRAAQAFPTARPSETCGEYSLRLRDAAQALR